MTLERFKSGVLWLVLMVGVNRRNVLKGLVCVAGGLGLGGCDLEEEDGVDRFVSDFFVRDDEKKYRVISSEEIFRMDGLRHSGQGVKEKVVLKSGKGIVVLDAGHGFGNKSRGRFDPGACWSLKGVVKFREADIVLGQAYRIGDLLKRDGYEVHLARKDNEEYVSRSARVRLAEKLGADVLISLHVNSFDDSSACGQLVLYGKGSDREAESIVLGEFIHKSLLGKIDGKYKTNGKGVKTDVEERGEKFRVLYSRVPSVIVESGFLSNVNDRGILTDGVYDVERAVADGVCGYLSRGDR